ncbi:MAG: hypothetical protein AAGM84_00640 [Pseudomonadota bacterium]
MTSFSRHNGLFLVATFVFILGVLTFNWNLLQTADTELFSTFQTDSDSLVLQALGADARMLGVETDAGFTIYPSQYGAQLLFFRAIGGLDVWSPVGLASVNATLMALVVAIVSFLTGRRIFGIWGAAAFGIWLCLSPMAVMMAGSIYWMSWTWLLPFLVSLSLAPRLWSSTGLLLAVVLWWITLTVKNLFGYEFASTIAISAAVPIVIYGLKQGKSVRATAVPCFVLAAVSVVAMATALVLHVNRLPDDPNGLSGWAQIGLIAEKRIADNSTPEALRAACEITPRISALSGADREKAINQCAKNLARTQEASRPVVVLAYSTFRRTVPWLAGPDIIDSEELVPVRGMLRRGDLSGARAALAGSDSAVLRLASLPATILIVWSLIALVIWSIWRRRDKAQAYAILVSAAAPLSWYLLATAHSYGHLHIAFILWNVPFLPVLAGMLFSAFDERHA